VAAEPAFLKVGNLYEELPRDVSEQIEEQIILHSKTFTRGTGFADLARHGQQWGVKINKGSQSANRSSGRRCGEYGGLEGVVSRSLYLRITCWALR